MTFNIDGLALSRNDLINKSQPFAKAIAFGNNQEFTEGDKQMQDIMALSHHCQSSPIARKFGHLLELPIRKDLPI